MSLIHARVEGKIGHVTLTRPEALNALSAEMLAELAPVLRAWAVDDAIALVVLDAEGEKAFCAGGDIAELHNWGKTKAQDSAREFWRDEYQLNGEIFEYPKPFVSFMQGFVMGGGVGLGCHASHRVVCESSKIAMPESAIGLVPDVGGSWLLGQAPGRLGEYLGATGARMTAGDAIYAGFADGFIPRENWSALIERLAETGDYTLVEAAFQAPPEGKYAAMAPEIDLHYGGESMGDIIRSLRTEDTEFTRKSMEVIAKNSPLSMCATIELIHRQRRSNLTIWSVLEMEYRFTARAIDDSDFLEGVRAKIIEKDNSPKWQHSDAEAVPPVQVSQLLLPLGADKFTQNAKATQ
jgi:enoyl-CoA hydratase